MWAEQSPTRSDPEGSSRNEFASGHAGLSPCCRARAAASRQVAPARRPQGLRGATARLRVRTSTCRKPPNRFPTGSSPANTGPTDFTDLIGQEAMVRTLRNAFATGRIAHAFMLTGVRGVGKTTTARIIARALNCIGPDGKGGPTVDPCGVCARLRRHRRGPPRRRDRDGRRLRTGVDDMREMIEGVRYRPVAARYKVYIIDEVHMLSTQRLQRAAEDAGGAAAAREVRLRHHRDPQGAGDGAVALPALRPAARAAGRAGRAFRHASPGRRGSRSRPAALALIARAADGSVRDGLSLLDQAIAHGGRRGRCGAGARHAGSGRPQPRARPVREDHARRCGRRRRPARRDARCRRRSGGDPAGPARAHPLGDPDEDHARGAAPTSPTASARRASRWRRS